MNVSKKQGLLLLTLIIASSQTVFAAEGGGDQPPAYSAQAPVVAQAVGGGDQPPAYSAQTPSPEVTEELMKQLRDLSVQMAFEQSKIKRNLAFLYYARLLHTNNRDGIELFKKTLVLDYQSNGQTEDSVIDNDSIMNRINDALKTNGFQKTALQIAEITMVPFRF